MARQSNHEAADRADSGLSKALDVIIDSYNGAPADRLYRDAIYCFDSLIEISRNTEDIIDFARKNEMDNKYLVDGANFVISKMHFNSEGNFYITLGLPKNATQNEIRERWKRLMLLYHPDKQLGEEEWVSERAKKVNEAYSTLKDEDKRQSYDLKLIEKSEHQHFILQPRIKPAPVATRHQKLRTSDNPEWNRKKKYIPRIILGLYILSALAFFAYIYVQNNSEPLESALTAKPDETQHDEQISGSAEKKDSVNTIPVQPLIHTHTEKAVGKQQPLSGTNSLPEIAGNPVTSQTSKKLRETPEKQENQPGKFIAAGGTSPQKTMPLPASISTLRKPEGSQEPESKPSVSAFKENPKPEQETKKPELPLQANQIKADFAKTIQNQNAIELTKEEVENFIRLYSSVYLKNDINAFMSLFSESAVENNKLHYNDIRKTYQETFSEKTNYYKINNLTIVANGQTASVSGIYDLSRYISALDRWMRYSGKIQWKIAKENNTLKIIRMNYD
jgi:curved DNA-binding protein CbpA